MIDVAYVESWNVPRDFSMHEHRQVEFLEPVRRSVMVPPESVIELRTAFSVMSGQQVLVYS